MYRLMVNALTHCATLSDNNFREENIYKFIHVLSFIVYLMRKLVTIWRAPYHLIDVEKLKTKGGCTSPLFVQGKDGERGGYNCVLWLIN